jgi:hypothetical protein
MSFGDWTIVVLAGLIAGLFYLWMVGVILESSPFKTKPKKTVEEKKPAPALYDFEIPTERFEDSDPDIGSELLSLEDV